MRNSTKSRPLTKPRAGANAVTTTSVSPASGSSSRCTRCGESNGMVTLDRFGPIRLRLMVSARVVSMAVSPICTVQVGAIDIDGGQMRMIEFYAHDVGVGRMGEFGAADGAAWFAVERAEIDIGVGIEHDPQRVGAIEHRRRRRRRERKRQFQIGALAGDLGCDLALGLCRARAWRRRGVGRRFVGHGGLALRWRRRRRRCLCRVG